jgi:hypothetical protein
MAKMTHGTTQMAKMIHGTTMHMAKMIHGTTHTAKMTHGTTQMAKMMHDTTHMAKNDTRHNAHCHCLYTAEETKKHNFMFTAITTCRTTLTQLL